MALILFFDTKTGGFPIERLPDDHPDQPALVQLGAILVDEDNGAEWATLDVVIKPNGWVIPETASRVHGITTAVAELVGIPLSCAVPMFVHLRNKAAKVVCHNPSFDRTITRQAIARNGKPCTLPGPDAYECTGELAAKIVELAPTESMKRWGRGGQPKPPKLTEAYRFFFGRKLEGAHSALADARTCKDVYFEIKRREAEDAALDVEIVSTKCPRCLEAVATRWVKGGGLLSAPAYDLVADVVFHSGCWDEQVAENPPGVATP